MFFSIIMPIYAVEKYLPEAVQSVLEQNFNDYELILVDDGSPDGCPQLCDEYASSESKVNVIHKKNGGLSDARNAGLQVAKGDYILFLDSDDFMVKGCLKEVHEQLEDKKTDLLVCKMLNLKEGSIFCKNDFSPKNISIKNTTNFVNDFIIKYNYLPWAAYQNVYKRSFLIQHNIEFDKNIIGAEDCDFFVSLLQNEPIIKVSDIKLVIYRMNREGSIITSPSFNAVFGQLEVFAKCFDYYKRVDTKMAYTFFANRFANVIVLISYLKREDADQCTNFIISRNYILRYCRKTIKYTVAKVLWKILGFYIGSQVLNNIRMI